MVVDCHDDDPPKDAFPRRHRCRLRTGRIGAPSVRAAPSIFDYYRAVMDAVVADEDLDRCVDIPAQTKYGPNTVMAKRHGSDRLVYVSIECECDWEPEKLLMVVFREGRTVGKVGLNDGNTQPMHRPMDAVATPLAMLIIRATRTFVAPRRSGPGRTTRRPNAPTEGCRRAGPEVRTARTTNRELKPSGVNLLNGDESLSTQWTTCSGAPSPSARPHAGSSCCRCCGVHRGGSRCRPPDGAAPAGCPSTQPRPGVPRQLAAPSAERVGPRAGFGPAERRTEPRAWLVGRPPCSCPAA